MDEKKERSVYRVRERIATLEAMLEHLEENPSDMNHLYKPPLMNLLRQDRKTVECVESGEPFLASEFTYPTELLAAMDIHWYFHFERTFSSVGVPDAHILEDLQGCEKLPIPPDVCTAVRLGFYYLHIGVYPRPSAYLAMGHPCDAVVSMHVAYTQHPEWRDVPMFAADAPYHGDERSLDYFADELKRMLDFVTKHTGKTLDMSLLREVIEKTNEGYLLWQEYYDLRRAIPIPHNHRLAMACTGMLLCEGGGRPEHIKWFQDLVADAEMRISEKRPEMPNQKIRMLWFDFVPVFIDHLAPWMEEEFGAIIAMDMISHCPFKLIDTSTEESLFRGLAERSLHHPTMISINQGPAVNVIFELTRLVKDFKPECVIFPGHMGHKDQAASVGIMTETCRKLGIPSLHIGIDNLDERYTTLDEIKDKISRFFYTMRLA
jgi:hypothetical protein